MAAVGILESMQEKIAELEGQVALLQRQLFMLAAAVGFDVIPHATGAEAVVGGSKTPVSCLTYDKLGLVERGGRLYRPKDAPKMTAPKPVETKSKTKELTIDDLDMDDLE